MKASCHGVIPILLFGNFRIRPVLAERPSFYSAPRNEVSCCQYMAVRIGRLGHIPPVSSVPPQA